MRDDARFDPCAGWLEAGLGRLLHLDDVAARLLAGWLGRQRARLPAVPRLTAAHPAWPWWRRLGLAEAALAARDGDDDALVNWLVDAWRPGEPVGPVLAALTAEGFPTVAAGIARSASSDLRCPDRDAASAWLNRGRAGRARTW